MHLYVVDFPHDSSFSSEKKAVQTHTFTDFPHTAESDEEEVYDKEQVNMWWSTKGINFL